MDLYGRVGAHERRLTAGVCHCAQVAQVTHIAGYGGLV